MCFSEQFETGITAEQYIDFDHELTSTQGKLSDPKILLEATCLQENDSKKDETKINDGELLVAAIAELLKAIPILEKIRLFAHFFEDLRKSLKALNLFVGSKSSYVMNFYGSK